MRRYPIICVIRLRAFLRRYTQGRIGIVVRLDNLRDIFNPVYSVQPPPTHHTHTTTTTHTTTNNTTTTTT